MGRVAHREARPRLLYRVDCRCRLTQTLLEFPSRSILTNVHRGDGQLHLLIRLHALKTL